jgi:DNA-binding protein
MTFLSLKERFKLVKPLNNYIIVVLVRLQNSISNIVIRMD